MTGSRSAAATALGSRATVLLAGTLGVVPAIGCGWTAPCGDRAQVTLTPEGLPAVTRCAPIARSDEARRAGLRAIDPLGPDDALVLRYPMAVKACITTAVIDHAIDAVFVGDDGVVSHVACARGPDDPTVCHPDTVDVIELLPHPDCPGWVGARVQVQE